MGRNNTQNIRNSGPPTRKQTVRGLEEQVLGQQFAVDKHDGRKDHRRDQHRSSHPEPGTRRAVPRTMPSDVK